MPPRKYKIAGSCLLNKEQHYIGLKTDLGSTTYPSLPLARVRARLPTAVLFFLLSQVSQFLSETHKKLVFGGVFHLKNYSFWLWRRG